MWIGDDAHDLIEVAFPSFQIEALAYELAHVRVEQLGSQSVLRSAISADDKLPI